MPDFDKLHEQIKKLEMLLDDRQAGEGTISWNIMVYQHLETIAEMWNKCVTESKQGKEN